MIQVSAQAQITPILLQLDKLINRGMQTSANALAITLKEEARLILAQQIAASGGKETGNLSNAIMSREMSTGISTYAQAEVLVDTSRAPYAEWIELGRFAANVPYKNSADERNYHNSKFVGHRYLGKALNRIKRIASETVLKGILNSVSNPLSAGAITKKR